MRDTYCIPMHLCIIIIISLLANRCFCVDQKYIDCAPRNCGNISISFPFFIAGVQPPYCGSPGFNITCENKKYPLLHMPEDNQELLVDKIFYDNRSVRVSMPAFRSNSGNCGTIRQIARNLTVRGDRFQLMEDSTLVLLWNCSSDTRLDKYRVVCDDVSYLVMNGNDTNLRTASGKCTVRAMAPILNDEKIISSMNYSAVLRRGFLLKWTASDCRECKSSGGRCGLDLEDFQFQCFCQDRPHYRNCTIFGTLSTTENNTENNTGLKIGVASGAAVGIIILLILALVINYCRMKTTHSPSLFPQNASSYTKDIDAFISQYGSSIPKRFRYSTLKKITNSFKDELGKGGYGNVYKGHFADGRVVAVKVLKETKGDGEEFVNEVASIGRTSHVNVVTLLGFCYEGKRRALLYEFMPNGSLEKFIYGTTPSLEGQHLGWEKLYSIAVGIARGLEYLHRGCNTRILHFDIKPHNILLDENFRPKISDFGLAKLYNTDESIISSLLQARGTIGYIAPEVTSRNFGQVSHKSDVYSYGMMTLEMVGGRKNVNAGADHTSEIYYPRWLYKRIQSDDVLNLANEISAEENELVRKMVIVGLWCIQIYPTQRPSISKVIEMLEGQTAALEIPPHPYLCSVPSSPSNSPEKLLFCSSSGTGPTSSA